MRRLFTFGCSHTNWFWHTWADILGLNFEQYFNFGKYGTGNFRILNQIQRANEYFEFNKNDYIAICLSSDFRYDIIDSNSNVGWVQNGCMLNERTFYTEHLEKQLDWIGGYENTLTCIKSIKNILNTTKANVRMLSAFGFDRIDYKHKKNHQNVFDKIFLEINKHLHSPISFHTLPSISTYDTLTYNVSQKKGKKKKEDGHFTIPIHLDFVKQHFSDWYDTKYDNKVMSWHKELPSYIEGPGGMNEYKAKDTEKHVFEFNGPLLIGQKYLKEYHGCERTIVTDNLKGNILL